MKILTLQVFAVSLCMPHAALAQELEPQKDGMPVLLDDIIADGDIDPDSPLAPLPEIEVDWPDFEELPPLPDVETETAADTENTLDSGASAAAELPVADAGTTDDAARYENRATLTTAEIAANREKTLDYGVTFDYLDSTGFVAGQKDAFEERFNQLSKLRTLEDEGGNVAQIRRRAIEDEKLLDQLVRNYGYYDADIYQTIDRSRDPAKLNVEFGLQLGPVYSLRDIALNGITAAGPDAPVLRNAFGLQIGDPVNSEEIVAAEARLDEGLAENGYPFAKIGDPDLLIDHAARAGDLTLAVMPKGKYAFGQILTNSDRLMSARHIQRIARFRPGDVYRRSRLEDLRRALLATGLVSSLKITPVASGRTPESKTATLGTVDINVETVAAPLRTVAGELGYGSGEGIRAEVSWEHRNLFPPEGLLRVRGVAGTQEQLASLLYRRNNFKKRDQVLTAQLLASNVNRNAFDARTLLFRTGIERQTNLIFQKKWTWSPRHRIDLDRRARYYRG